MRPAGDPNGAGTAGLPPRAPNGPEAMHVLALEPYYGGSHQAFLDGWSARSRHAWTTLSLPARKWKWRMRHGSITLAEQAAEHLAQGLSWEVIVCSDMLDLAAFRGLGPLAFRALPAVAYFHENQLTYPVHRHDPRDRHFGFTNFTTALAAASVWFNSAFHRDSFLDGLSDFLRRMPDHQMPHRIEEIRGRARVCPPGVDPFPSRQARRPGPIRILWAARWEYDKGPETLLEALRLLAARNVDFRLSVIGQQFRQSPPAFQTMRQLFSRHIDRWGYQRSRQDYAEALGEADVFVSTAEHEFFGISAVEAMAAGAYPLLPRRLAYPEIVAEIAGSDARDFLYNGTAKGLAARLASLALRVDRGELWRHGADLAEATQARFGWHCAAGVLDEALAEAAGSR